MASKGDGGSKRRPITQPRINYFVLACIDNNNRSKINAVNSMGYIIRFLCLCAAFKVGYDYAFYQRCYRDKWQTGAGRVVRSSVGGG